MTPRRMVSILQASPGLTAGRGLKHAADDRRGSAEGASPGLTAGRGLKHPGTSPHEPGEYRIARPHGRARIETRNSAAAWRSPVCIARPHGRARIETFSSRRPAPVLRCIARPHGRARIETTSCAESSSFATSIARPHGRARIETVRDEGRLRWYPASPGLTAGRGLKPPIAENRHLRIGASSGLTAGRGLKLSVGGIELRRIAHRPASRPGAD